MKRVLNDFSRATMLVGAGMAIANPALAQSTAPQPAQQAVAPPVFSWQGFYAGVSGGYGHMHADSSASNADSGLTTITSTLPTTLLSLQTLPFAPQALAAAIAPIGDSSNFSLNDESWFLGAQAGYDEVVGPVVVGGVFDISGADLSERKLFTDGSVKVGLNWFATARLRVGLPIDRFLVYGTGGLAIGGIDAKLSNALGSVSDSFTKVGWAAGAGVSYAVTDNVVVDLSYLHLGFGSHTTSGFPGRIKTKVSSDLIRFGVGYKF